MSNKVELLVPASGLISGVFFEEAVLKIVVTVLAMVLGQTVAFYWKKWLEKNSKK